MVPLNKLVQALHWDVPVNLPKIGVTSIRYDSRQVEQGSVFVALTGGTTDGHRFIPQAVQKGAVAVIGERAIENITVPYFQVDDSRLALALLSAAYNNFPARHLTVIGVTGTDGKTTTTNIIYQILIAAGLKAGMISTVNAVIGDQYLDTGFHVTTPEAPEVQHLLAQMVSSGLSHVVIEATSHGLEQKRVLGCDFDIGVVTNITHEHLDYHKTYESYRAAKGILFAELGKTSHKAHHAPCGAVLNQDDASFDFLRSLTAVPIVSYGLAENSQVRAENVQHLTDGTSFDAVVELAGGRALRFPVQTHFYGLYNVLNCLAATATAAGVLDLPAGVIQAGIRDMPGVPGRMEQIWVAGEGEAKLNFTAIVDFAHTPNALQRTLEACRHLTSGRVIVVFGSAGLRDRAKRRMMAEIAAQYADKSIFTAEDPRTESLEAILADMAAGAIAKGAEEGKDFWRIQDRGGAIRFAVNHAEPGDLVVACGKGHEQSMCFGEIEYPWDDRIAMRSALAELLTVPGPRMPKLPTSSL